MIETLEIKMPSKKMLSILFLQYGMPWMVTAIVGLAIFIVLGFLIDFRFFMLALIWLFLILPLVIAFLYFFYGMNPLTAFNSLPHKILFSDSEIKVRIRENIQEETEPEYKDYTLKKEQFSRYKTGADYVLLFFKQKGWLWLPVSGFENITQFKNVLKGL